MVVDAGPTLVEGNVGGSDGWRYREKIGAASRRRESHCDGGGSGAVVVPAAVARMAGPTHA